MISCLCKIRNIFIFSWIVAWGKTLQLTMRRQQINWRLKDPQNASGGMCVRPCVLVSRLCTWASGHMPNGRSTLWRPERKFCACKIQLGAVNQKLCVLPWEVVSSPPATRRFLKFARTDMESQQLAYAQVARRRHASLYAYSSFNKHSLSCHVK